MTEAWVFSCLNKVSLCICIVRGDASCTVYAEVTLGLFVCVVAMDMDNKGLIGGSSQAFYLHSDNY